MKTVSEVKYSLAELNVLSESNEKKIDYGGFLVSTRSERYKVFSKNTKCVACGLEAQFLLLQQSFGVVENTAHFNMYAEVDGNLVLFTKDHHIPRAWGGRNRMNNYRTMCYPCNKFKADKIPEE